MPTYLPSDSELLALARQVDDQLNALQSEPAGNICFRAVDSGRPSELPAAPRQQALIARETGQPFETFWQKYLRHAQRDLCLPGGLLHDQWQKWKDLQSKDAVKMTLAALTGMGISTGNIPAIAVAASVFLLNVVTKIGIDAICENCRADPPARETAGKPATPGPQ